MQKKTEVALPCSLFKKQKLGWRSEAELEKKYKKKHARFTRDMPTDAGYRPELGTMLENYDTGHCWDS